MTTPIAHHSGVRAGASPRSGTLHANLRRLSEMLPEHPLDRLQVGGVALLLVLAAIIHPTPAALGPLEMGYAVMAGLVLGAWAWGAIRRGGVPFGPSEVGAVALVSILALTIIWAVPAGTSLAAWSRGLIPFLNLLLILPVSRLVPHEGSRALVIAALAVAAVLVAVQTYATAISLIPLMLESGTPLIMQNYASPQAYSPILVGMAAFSLGALLSPGHGRGRHFAMFGVLIPAVLLTFLKSLLLIFVGLAVLLGTGAVRRGSVSRIRRHLANMPGRRLAVSTAAVAFATLFVVVGLGRTLGAAYLAKFSALISGSAQGNSRTAEYAAVMDAWSGSPLLGKGLGYEYSYFRPELGAVWSDTYTHNMLSFVILTAGLVGAVVMVLFLMTVLRNAWHARRDDNVWVHGAAAAIYALASYGMLQATYRSLSYWLVVAVVAGILASHARTHSRPESRGG